MDNIFFFNVIHTSSVLKVNISDFFSLAFRTMKITMIKPPKESIQLSPGAGDDDIPGFFEPLIFSDQLEMNATVMSEILLDF